MLDVRITIDERPAEDLYRLGADAHSTAVVSHPGQGDVVPLVEPAVTDTCADDNAQ